MLSIPHVCILDSPEKKLLIHIAARILGSSSDLSGNSVQFSKGLLHDIATNMASDTPVFFFISTTKRKLSKTREPFRQRKFTCVVLNFLCHQNSIKFLITHGIVRIVSKQKTCSVKKVLNPLIFIAQFKLTSWLVLGTVCGSKAKNIHVQFWQHRT